ncbi:MAG: hypothetical protein AAGE01_14775 [Pseudomonadota bacterium]
MEFGLLIAAGCLGIFIATIHGYLGQTLLLNQTSLRTETANRMLFAVFHLSTLYWLAGGMLLLWLAFADDARLSQWGGGLVAATYLAAAAANCWASRGRHFGWMLLTGTAVLTLVAIW